MSIRAGLRKGNPRSGYVKCPGSRLARKGKGSRHFIKPSSGRHFYPDHVFRMRQLYPAHAESNTLRLNDLNNGRSAITRRSPYQISPPCSSTPLTSPPPFPSHGISISMDRRSESSLIGDGLETEREWIQWCRSRCNLLGQMIRIDAFPDDILLGIFNFYVDAPLSYAYEGRDDKADVEAWQSLVHVCRRWRILVFSSPRCLNLRLFCTPKALARKKLEVWPSLPLVIHGKVASSSDLHNVIAALGQSNRVYEAALGNLVAWQLEEILAVMQVPFPELTVLRLWSDGKTQSVVPDSFLDGSAPRLRIFEFRGIPFPGLPNLLLSATYLVELRLANIPHSGYFSPKAIVTLLSALSSLETFSLEFRSPLSFPDRESRRLPPSQRSVIPALTFLHFKGVPEYVEDLVTGIDTPQLHKMYISFFNQIDFDIPRLAQFIHRNPKLRKRDAFVEFGDDFARVGLLPRFDTFQIKILCKRPDWQLSSMEQICNSSLHLFSTVESLYIQHGYQQLVWKDDGIENALWLQLLFPFTAVQRLYLLEEFAPGIAAALQETVEDRLTEVLPRLKEIFVEGLEASNLFKKNIRPFLPARRRSNPIDVFVWDELRHDEDWD